MIILARKIENREKRLLTRLNGEVIGNKGLKMLEFKL
jgi:hypothetical protein